MAKKSIKHRLPSGSVRIQAYDYTDDSGKKHYRSFTAPTLAEAVEKAYQTVAAVHFENAYYRNDIGARALAAGRN